MCPMRYYTTKLRIDPPVKNGTREKRWHDGTGG